MSRGVIQCPWCAVALARDAKDRCDRCGRPIEIVGDVARHGSLRVSGSGRRSSELVALAICANTTIATLLVATQSIPLAVLSLLAGVVALTIQSIAGTSSELRVEADRLVETRGVVVLRENVARIAMTTAGLRVDTIHGETRHVDIEAADGARRVLDDIHLAWPDLTRFDRRTLVRSLAVRPRAAHAELAARLPFTIERAHPGDGYREGGEVGVRLVHLDAPHWALIEEHGTWRVEQATGTTRLSPPIVLVHLWRDGVRVVTADTEITLPCARARDAREGVRLARSLLLRAT
jgi:hypothetical protein